MIEHELDTTIADELLDEMQALETVFGMQTFYAAILSLAIVYIATHPVETRVEMLLRIGERADLIAKKMEEDT